MNDMQQEMFNALCKLSGEKVAQLFLDWLGLQVMDRDFREFLGNEGVMDELEDNDLDEDEDTEEETSDIEEQFLNFCAAYSRCVGCPFEDEDVYEGEECIDLYRQILEQSHED